MRSTPNVLLSVRAERVLSYIIERGNTARTKGHQCRWDRDYDRLASLAVAKYPGGSVELPAWVYEGSLD